MRGIAPAILFLASCCAFGQVPFEGAWRLVRFQGGDGTVLTPDDRAKYTIQFMPDGRLVARIDCNRGRGTWKSAGPNQLEFGPLALTRAQCPPGSLHDRIVKHWSYFRSYVMRDGHLFLSLMADGGIYEFEPAGGGSAAAYQSPVQSIGPVIYDCNEGTLTATFYHTQPGLVLLERNGRTRPAFQVISASGARYEGDGLHFWEARGEASVHWSGAELKCRPQPSARQKQGVARP